MSKKNKTQNVTEEEVKTEETPIQTEQTETKKQQQHLTILKQKEPHEQHHRDCLVFLNICSFNLLFAC